MPRPPSLILFSGMGADQRMFAEQLKAMPELRVPEWLPPRPNESLRQYACRMADAYTGEEPVVIGGASFGGFLALEMLPYVNARACLLVGAVRTPEEYPLWIRLLKPLAPLCPVIPFELFLPVSGFLGYTLGWLLPARMREFLQLGGSLDPKFFRWASRAVLKWGDDGPPPEPRVPVYHIHGRRDRILPIRRTTPTDVVPDGGHVIAISNPDEVTAFLRKHFGTGT